jgi:hypothetical protein
VPYGRARSATAAAARSAAIGSAHVGAHASASARPVEDDVVIDAAAAVAAKKMAEAHVAAQARAEVDASSLNRPVPMQTEIEEGQEQLAKRQRPRRGYCLDVERGAWYEGNVYEQVGSGNFKMQYDGPYQTELNIPPHRLVADTDSLHVTWESPEDPDAELVFKCEVSIRDFNGEKDVVFLVNPHPTWEVDEATGDALEYTLMLNPRTARQRENQPQWAHSREALIEKLAALVVGAS